MRIVKLYKYLIDENQELVLSRQVLKSDTSIGANIEEAIGGHTEKDFYFKLTIAYKEARETNYWLRLLRDSNFLDGKLAESLLTDCNELLKIMGAIQKTIKAKHSIRSTSVNYYIKNS